MLKQRKERVFKLIECNLKVYIFVFVYSEEIIKLFIFICDIFKCINTFYTNCISQDIFLAVYIVYTLYNTSIVELWRI